MATIWVKKIRVKIVPRTKAERRNRKKHFSVETVALGKLAEKPKEKENKKDERKNRGRKTADERARPDEHQFRSLAEGFVSHNPVRHYLFYDPFFYFVARGRGPKRGPGRTIRDTVKIAVVQYSTTTFR